jgi:hypothetical protein
VKKKAPGKKGAAGKKSAGLSRIGLRARPGSRVTEAAVRDVGGVVVKLLRTKRCSAENLLKEASDPDNPAYRYFEWNNEIAAHEWRLDQARRYISAIEIVATDASKASVRIAWPSGHGMYVTFEEMKSDHDLLKSTIADCVRDLEAFERKFTMLRGLPEAQTLIGEFAARWSS